jgi:hypothetical protein
MKQMNRKSMIAFLLALLAIGGNAVAEEAVSTANRQTAVPANQRIANNKMVVYYFHGNQRCATCKKIEALTKKTLEEGYAEQLKNGSLELQVVNVDISSNEHFVKDYELAVRSIVLSKMEGGKETTWRRLDQVWQLVHDEAAFTAYLREEINLVINGKG